MLPVDGVRGLTRPNSARSRSLTTFAQYGYLRRISVCSILLASLGGAQVLCRVVPCMMGPTGDCHIWIPQTRDDTSRCRLQLVLFNFDPFPPCDSLDEPLQIPTLVRAQLGHHFRTKLAFSHNPPTTKDNRQHQQPTPRDVRPLSLLSAYLFVRPLTALAR